MANNTRQKIVSTAMELFWQNSYETVGTDLICKTANIRKGSLYHFFPSKDDLALEVLNRRWEMFENQVLKLAFSPEIEPVKRFYRFSDILSNMACRIKEQSGDVYGCPFGNFASELSTSKTAIRGRIAEIFEEYTSYFERSLQDAVKNGNINCPDIKSTAKIIFAGVQGTVLVAKASNNPSVLKENFERLFSQFLAR